MTITALQPVEGHNNIVADAYDSATQTLAVQFKDGGTIYHYQGVPPDVASGYFGAESRARYVNAAIKGAFEFEKVEPASGE